MIHLQRQKAVAMVCAAAVLAAGWPLYAAGRRAAKPAASPSEKTEKIPEGQAKLRVWKGVFPSEKTISIQAKGVAKGGTWTDLGVLEKGYRFTEYFAVPATDLEVEVREDNAKGERLRTLPVHLTPGSSATLIINEVKGELKTEMLNEAQPPAKATVGELVVRNFIPTLANLTVSIGDDVRVGLKSSECSLNIRGLRRDVLQVDTVAQEEGGKAVRWSNEVDFSKNPKATLLVYPDPYGRIRPRILIDDNVSGNDTGH